MAVADGIPPEIATRVIPQVVAFGPFPPTVAKKSFGSFGALKSSGPSSATML